MKNQVLYAVICSLSILFLFPACVVKKPDSGRISGLDYNKRVTVYDAHYRKKPTVFGISFVVAGTAAGGYLGYQSNLIGYQDGPDRKFVQPANAVIGALIGYSLTNLCNYALGQNKTYPVTDVRKWAKDANKNYLLLSQSGSSFTLMHNSAESSFLVKNIQDARDFRTCFPNSSYSNSIALQGTSVVKREELPELLSLFPGNAGASDMKSGFLAQSTSLGQCIEAKNKYPELSAEAERKASGYVSTLDDLRTFRNNFANSGYANEIVGGIYQRLKREELPLLVDLYPSLPAMGDVKKEYINKSNGFDQFLEAINRYPGSIQDEEYRLAGLVHSVSAIKAFQNKFGAACKNIDLAFKNANEKINWTEIPDLVNTTPKANEELKTNSLNTYRKNLAGEFNKCVDASSCNSFISNFRGRFETEDLISKATYKYDFYSARSIPDWARFAGKYPDKFAEADGYAFYQTSTTNASPCREYLNYFPNGAFVAEANERLQQAMAYESEQTAQRIREQLRREEARCYLKLIGVKCIDQEDWTGTDQIYFKVDGEELTDEGRISTGQIMDLTNLSPIEIEGDGKILLQLYEYDWDSDDLLVSTNVGCQQVARGMQELYGDGGGGEYMVYYNIHHTWDAAISDQTRPPSENRSYSDYGSNSSSGSTAPSYTLGEWETNSIFSSDVHDDEKIKIKIECNGYHYSEYIGRDLKRSSNVYSAGTNVCEFAGSDRFNTLEEAIQHTIKCVCEK